MQRPRWSAVSAALLLAIGCKARAPEPARQAAPGSRAAAPILSGLRDAPGGYVLDTTSTPDAEHRRYSVPHPVDTVLAYYRAELARTGWRLLSDRADKPAGRFDLMAEKDSMSLWVHLEKNGEQAALASLIAHDARPAARP